MQRFLIIQTAFLGDVILTTPIVSELYRLYPKAKIDFVVRKGNETLLKNNPKINQVLIWNKQHYKYKHLFQLIRSIRNNKYDEVFTVQRYTNAGIISLLAKAKKRTGYKQNALSWQYNNKVSHSLLDGSHEVERNLRLLAHHNAKQRIRPELFPADEDWNKVSQYKDGKYYCIAPASVWETKKLPMHKWEELIQLIHSKGKIYLLGGLEDQQLCEVFKSKFKDSVINLAGKLSLLQSAALMKDAMMNFVNDSGPLHIASAMNAPTRAFFCSTVPVFGFGPLAEDAKIIETEKPLACRPCTFHGRKSCPLDHYDCGNTIEITEATIA